MIRALRWCDALIKIDRISWIKSLAPYVLKDGATSVLKDGATSVPKDDPELWVSSEDDPKSWDVQILRSIDSGSLKGFPKSADLAEKQNLICAKNFGNR